MLIIAAPVCRARFNYSEEKKMSIRGATLRQRRLTTRAISIIAEALSPSADKPYVRDRLLIRSRRSYGTFKFGERPTRLMPPDPDNSGSIFIDNSRAKSVTMTKAESRPAVAATARLTDGMGPLFFGTHSMMMIMMMAERDLAPVRAVAGCVDLKIKNPLREKRLLRILDNFTTR